MKEDMRGLFYIVRGQYKRDNDEDGICVSGYDPENKDNMEWYRLIDRNTFQCLACGTDYKKVLRGVYTLIKTYKTAERFYRFISDTTSDDYYEVHYLGHAPLTPDQRQHKAIGRQPRTSPAMRRLEEKVFAYYGDYYEDDIVEMEDLAYTELKENTPFKRSRKILGKVKPITNTTPKGEVKSETHRSLVAEERKPLSSKKLVQGEKKKKLLRKSTL